MIRVDAQEVAGREVAARSCQTSPCGGDAEPLPEAHVQSRPPPRRRDRRRRRCRDRGRRTSRRPRGSAGSVSTPPKRQARIERPDDERRVLAVGRLRRVLEPARAGDAVEPDAQAAARERPVDDQVGAGRPVAGGPQDARASRRDGRSRRRSATPVDRLDLRAGDQALRRQRLRDDQILVALEPLGRHDQALKDRRR